MATTVRPAKQDQTREVDYVSRNEAIQILDRQARTYLGISGEEFVRRYRAGEIEDPDRTEVILLATLIPLTDP